MGEIKFVGTGETGGYPYLVCKKAGYHGSTGAFRLFRFFSVAISVSPHVCYLRVNFNFYVSKIMHL